MNVFEKITESPETLASLLRAIPAIETPWDDAFHRLYCSSCSAADCTPAEKVEIEYLFDFYKRLWEKEKDAFLAAYIQKHRIFAIRADVEPQEMSLEESIKMSALMRGMSDESPLRAIEAGK